MPRAFTAVEKEKIRERLFAAGRSCFTRYGLKKTTIEDLVKPAGIAKASFYLFFGSKEALYLDLLLQEVPAMMSRMIAASFGSTDDTREALVLMMKAIVHEMQTNELARIILDNPTELERFAAGLDYEEILRQVAGPYAPIIEAITVAQARGKIIAGDPFQIVYSLGLVKMLVVYRDRIPTDLYNAMIDFAPQVIADGLTCPARMKTTAEATKVSATNEKKEVS